MTAIQTWIQTPLAIAIAKTLVHSLWQCLVVAVALAAGLRFTHASRLRYAAACAALVLVVVISIGSFFYLLPGSLAHTSLSRIFFPELVSPDPDANGLTAVSWPLRLKNALPWLTPIWLIGVLLFNVRHVANFAASARLRRRGVCPAPEAWQQWLNGICNRLSIVRPVVLLESCLTQVPLVVGHLRPAILAPLGFLTGLPSEQVELILMHELAHIRRCDYLINVLQSLVEGAMFYNPAVWWISRTIRSEREHCCDDIVVNAAHSAHAYAAALVALEENRSSRAQLALAATGGSLVKRIRRILRQPQPSSPVAPIFAAAVAIFVVAGFLVARQPIPERPAQGATQATYKTWLDEDVVYIITDAERAAFQSLRTNDERNAFIEQFWQRRDPTPGTPENEYRDEHYGRIAYANLNFSSHLPAGFGWKTDRGRTYIRFGPPDEIESHPSGGTYVRPIEQGGGTTSTFPFEVWLYRHIDGVGNNVLMEFVDSKGTGEYPQTTDPAANRR